jgi:hypothetical protein
MLTTRDLMRAWYGVDVRTRRVFTAVTVLTTLTKLCDRNAQRIRIAIANTSLAQVNVQHTLNTNNELPIPVPARGTYLENWQDDDDWVESEFHAVSTGLDQFGNPVAVVVNVIETILL